MNCSVEGCDRTTLALGLCTFHYKRQRFGRELEAPRRPEILLPKTHPVYVAWVNMKTRCDNPRSTQYKWYGGRGIAYDESWRKFHNFHATMYLSWEAGKVLDRRDNNADYGPDNCRWVTHAESANNRRPRSKKNGP